MPTVRLMNPGEATLTFDSASSGQVNPVPIAASYGYSEYTHYIKLTLCSDEAHGNSGILRFSAYAPYGISTTRIKAWLSNSDAYNSFTGLPYNATLMTANNGTQVYTSMATIFETELNFGENSTKVVYLWWKNTDTEANKRDIACNILWKPAPEWKHIDDTISSNLVVTYRPPEPIIPEPNTVYQFAVKFSETGEVRFRSLSSISNDRLYVTRGSGWIFNDQSGTVSGEDVIASYDTLFFTAQANTWYYFWIRHWTGSATDPIDFEIVPPGELWFVEPFISTTQTIDTGSLSWTVSASDSNPIDRRTILYIPIRFQRGATYRFYASSVLSYDFYLTTSTNIDENGVPTDIVPSATGTTGNTIHEFTFQSSFSSSAINRTYYLMFRESDGERANRGIDPIQVSYVEDYIVWRLSSQTLGLLQRQYKNYHNYSDSYVIFKKVVRFNQPGTISFYSLAPSGPVADERYPKAWITRHTDDFDEANGTPPSDSSIRIAEDSNPSGDRQFSITTQVSANTNYDFWFRLCDGSQTGYGYVVIDVPGGGGTQPDTWRFVHDMSGDRSEVTDKFTESTVYTAGVGEYFKVRFAATGDVEVSIPSSAEALLYVSRSESYGGDTGVPSSALSGSGGSSVRFTVASTDQDYYIWVRGSTTIMEGTVTVTVTPFQWSVSAMSESPIYLSSTERRIQYGSMSEGIVYLVEVSFSSSGQALFYSGGARPRLAWVTASNNDITPSTGVPILPSGESYIASDESGDGNFEFEFTAVAGTTYYFWIRAKDFTDTTALDLYLRPPSGGVTSKGLWICTVGGSNPTWTKVKVFVCTSLNPVTWILVEHPSVCSEGGSSPSWIVGT